ncbi:4Fe-4S dicluster domain-containing protein [Anaerosphaera aminiphila DSM 21120]|uniref:4Fe-4S dicluster domain-containing protein n=1 Tax=Anaerosphaera aminiphila DSM 21120 TaxID=1120995 RepID=A0A1M5Q5V0_9FIRM|nr:EFR1 family ferrodoxin [Anaerosphaera aminiphila]SHH09352.1 4Fe-4S dicluster domain-containing protein [Anaerosphaera aminiphila DSM 21120]
MLGVYFSGTGNTKYCVEKFLENFEGSNTVSIEDSKVLDEIKNNSEIVFAYPIYFSNTPKIVSDFIVNNSEIFKNKNIFIIATMGLFSGDGTGCSARLFKKYGGNIIGGLHIIMPDNISDSKLLKKENEKNREIINRATKKIEKAAYSFKNGNTTREGLGLFSHILGLLGQRLWFSNKTKNYTDAIKIDSSKCINCKKCINICPMKNLETEANKVIAKSSCTMCYRCINICPERAITLLGKEVIESYELSNYIK